MASVETKNFSLIARVDIPFLANERISMTPFSVNFDWGNASPLACLFFKTISSVLSWIVPKKR
jgi:hypothetical protein